MKSLNYFKKLLKNKNTVTTFNPSFKMYHDTNIDKISSNEVLYIL